MLEELAQLDDEFITISSAFYRDRSLYSKNVLLQVDTAGDLQLRTADYLSRSDDISAIRLLHANEAAVMANIGSKATFQFLELLLKDNELKMAERIAAVIGRDGDRALKARMNFIFAKYYADRNAWAKVHDVLSGISSELPAEDAAYASLMDGVALQHLKKHREAIALYRKVPSSSRHYPEAQLNMAVASIRQGWWTDAQGIINEVAGSASANPDREISNRMHLVLGYALLEQGFYRNARDEFGIVSPDSRYGDKALLGIGLAAASQDDYTAGMRAFASLKAKDSVEWAVEEAHLLLPYMYAKLKQPDAVSAGYAEAVTHYEQEIAALEGLATQEGEFSPDDYDSIRSTLNVGEFQLAYGDVFPRAFLENYLLLRRIASEPQGTRMAKRVRAVAAKYAQAFQAVRRALLEARISQLRIYLNQARFGLANSLDVSRGAGK